MYPHNLGVVAKYWRFMIIAEDATSLQFPRDVARALIL